MNLMGICQVLGATSSTRLTQNALVEARKLELMTSAYQKQIWQLLEAPWIRILILQRGRTWP